MSTSTPHSLYARHKYKILAECFEEMLKNEGIQQLTTSMETRIDTMDKEDTLAQEILKREEQGLCTHCGKALEEEDFEDDHNATKCIDCWDKHGDD